MPFDDAFGTAIDSFVFRLPARAERWLDGLLLYRRAQGEGAPPAWSRGDETTRIARAARLS